MAHSRFGLRKRFIIHLLDYIPERRNAIRRSDKRGRIRSCVGSARKREGRLMRRDKFNNEFKRDGEGLKWPGGIHFDVDSRHGRLNQPWDSDVRHRCS